MRKSQLYTYILSAIEDETEVSRDSIIANGKQPDVVDARALLYHSLQSVGFYPSQIARVTGHSRQRVTTLLNGFDARCRYNKMLSIFAQNIRKKLTNISLF